MRRKSRCSITRQRYSTVSNWATRESRTVWSAMRANTVYTTWYTTIFELYRFIAHARSLARMHARSLTFSLAWRSLPCSLESTSTRVDSFYLDSLRLLTLTLLSSLSLGCLIEWLCHVSVLVSSRFRFLSFLYFPPTWHKNCWSYLLLKEIHFFSKYYFRLTTQWLI